MKHSKPTVEVDLSRKYYEFLAASGYTSGSADFYARIVRKIEAFMLGNQITEYTGEVAALFYGEFCRTPGITEAWKKRVFATIQNFTLFMGGRPVNFKMPRKPDEEPLPDEFRTVMDSFISHLAKHRGLKDSTISNHRRIIYFFLRFACGRYSVPISGLHPSIIEECYKAFTGNPAHFRATMHIFFGFLLDKGLVDKDYSLFILRILPCPHRNQPLPTVYTDEEINRIISAADSFGGEKGSRDAAILMLASRMGFRASDICGLKLADIDFTSGNIAIVQQKTGVPLKLPMPDGVAASVRKYLDMKHDSDSPYVFIRVRAPYDKLTHTGLWAIMRKYLSLAEIKTDGRKRGTHALRSSLASSMINNDVPYYVVQKALGHESPESTRHYARIDVTSLEKFAVPVPACSGNVRKLLEVDA